VADVFVSQGIVLEACQCGALAYFRPEDEICSRCDVSKLRARKVRAGRCKHCLRMRTCS